LLKSISCLYFATAVAGFLSRCVYRIMETCVSRSRLLKSLARSLAAGRIPLMSRSPAHCQRAEHL